MFHFIRKAVSFVAVTVSALFGAQSLPGSAPSEVPLQTANVVVVASTKPSPLTARTAKATQAIPSSNTAISTPKVVLVNTSPVPTPALTISRNLTVALCPNCIPPGGRYGTFSVTAPATEDIRIDYLMFGIGDRLAAPNSAYFHNGVSITQPIVNVVWPIDDFGHSAVMRFVTAEPIIGAKDFPVHSKNAQYQEYMNDHSTRAEYRRYIEEVQNLTFVPTRGVAIIPASSTVRLTLQVYAQPRLYMDSMVYKYISKFVSCTGTGLTTGLKYECAPPGIEYSIK